MFLYNLVDFPEFQSTLPRRERRNEIDFFLTSAYISIHAPAKGATNDNGSEIPPDAISIHAPAKGATSFFRFLSGLC